MIASTIIPLLALAGSAIAAPHAKRAGDEGSFGLFAARSGSPVHLSVITAADSAFWINKQTASYCPPVAAAVNLCPPGNETIVTINSTTARLQMDTVQLQNVYITAEGALQYTGVHSATSPVGSQGQGWKYTAGNGTLGTLVYQDIGFTACPTPTNATVYQIFATLGGSPKNFTSCLGIALGTFSYTGETAAWQYS